MSTPQPRPDAHRRVVATLVCGALTVALVAVLAVLPVPFVVESPGPVRNTLGTVDGTRLITISGAPTYPTKGSLDLTTVREAGGPGNKVDLVSVVVAWLSGTQVALPSELLFPVGSTAGQVQATDAAEMTSSQEDATAAALHELGIPVPTSIAVAGLPKGSTATGILRAGDVITAVDGRPVADADGLKAALQSGSAGRTVRVTITRAGTSQVVTAPTSTGSDGSVILGVLVDPRFSFPFPVTIKVDQIGGPSAGMMFALGVVDLLTPGSLTGGRAIAGTGTIDPDGTVGAIGGIAQKMAGAAAAGATAFLAPASNCDEVVGHVPEGLQVVKVSTLREARAAVADLAAGTGDDLATCTR